MKRRKAKSPSPLATSRIRLAPRSCSKTKLLKSSARTILLLSSLLMATTMASLTRVAVATTAASGPSVAKMGPFRGSSAKGRSVSSPASHRKRVRNISSPLGTAEVAFVNSHSRRNFAGTSNDLPLAIRTAAQESPIPCHCRNSNVGYLFGRNSALFSSASQDNASTSQQATAQKTLDKLPVELEQSILEDSEYHVYASEQTIKKSRFIGLARYADDWKDASNFVQHIRNKVHPKARHWCFAYRGSIVGGDDDVMDDTSASFATSTTITERASDDGEPSGTAGQPMLNALTTETTAPGGLIDVVVVVVRYSGGIKLGAGGLIRAYGGTARMVLQEHVDFQVEVIPKQKLSLSSIQPKHVGVVYELAAKHGATVVATNDDYTSFSVTCDSEVAEAFSAGMMDATRGSAVIR